ncbi:MAG: hypothetical protein JKX76_04955 [Colwellia sp.]|nr:hypothetical protein [Colwellia sp.]
MEELLFKPEKRQGFKEFCISQHKEISNVHQLLTNYGFIFIIYDFSLESAECFYNDICQSLNDFNDVFLKIIKQKYKRSLYEKHYQKEYEACGLSYIDYLKYNLTNINNDVLKYLAMNAMGELNLKEHMKLLKEARNSSNKKRRAELTQEQYIQSCKIDEIIPYENFNNPIPFVIENKNFLSDLQLTRNTLPKVELENVRQFVRLASICQGRKYIFKYLSNLTKDKSNNLVAKIWKERCDKWLYAADVHVEKINNLVSISIKAAEYGRKNTKKQDEEANCEEVKKIIDGLLDEKSPTYDKILSNKKPDNRLEYILKFCSGKFTKIESASGNDNYLKRETFCKHIKTYFEKPLK